MRQGQSGTDARTPLERRLGHHLSAQPSGECLSLEQLTALARLGRRAPEYRELMHHVITCPACRQALLQARALVRAQRPRPLIWLQEVLLPRPLVWMPALGALVIVALLVWYGRGTPSQVASVAPREPATTAAPMPEVPTPPAKRSSQPTPQLAQERVKPPASAAPPPSRETPQLPASQRELQAARQYAAFVQQAVRLLQQATAALEMRTMPRPATPWLSFVEPDLLNNAALEPNTRRFRWQPVPDAEGYEVKLIRASDGATLAAATLDAAQTELVLEAPLPAGSYELHLIAFQGLRQQTAHVRFYVLNAEQLQQLQWARHHAQDKPLLSAAVFYQIDRYKEALECLERAAQKYPNDAQVEKWRAVVQARLRLRASEFAL